MDAIVLLKDDHKTVEKLFKQYEKAAKQGHEGQNAKAKADLVAEMIQELTTHTFIEEEIFYPAAKAAAPDTKDHVLESVEEHHMVAWLLSELGGLDPQDESFDAKVTVLMENVRHHVKEEEEDWFPTVRAAMGRKLLQDLGEQMAAAKEQAPSDPLKLSSARAGV
ncbi:hemerythrin domain-containing protein [Actinocrinis puniceicyclus]|uniref:Hemerythrin domain-containing protein n=1 Tax=Actinocrinis puniceicyclus TaxID=977794 RepID=A0A8J7WSK8_9ACTN|nr:hemerythrin domain-containing protein [Actinocrinis puniceicyclus]MBS2965697.1 hemerythrin domain-containing protein [Actinocrinis puniceicyclus]